MCFNVAEPMPKIEPMLHRKAVESFIGVSERTMDTLLKDVKFRRQIGAKRVGRQWRFIAWRVEMFTQTSDN